MYLCGAGHPERTHEDWEQIGYDKGYKKGRSDQGELNTDIVREIHELVYQQGIEKGREEALQPIQKLLDDWFCDRVDDPNWVLSQISICIFEQTKERSND